MAGASTVDCMRGTVAASVGGQNTLRRGRPEKKSVVKRPRLNLLRMRRNARLNYERKRIGGVVR